VAFRLVPRDTKFFDMFAEMAGNLGEAARLLKQILDDFKDIETRVQKLKDIEHRGDELTHNILTKLNQTFITPFDREDIYRLASSLDDVLDFTYSAGVRLVMYKITGAPPAASRLAEIVVKQSDQLLEAVARLEKKHDHVLECCLEINRLENEADAVSRAAIGELFDREKDPIALIKLKELYEALETATDKAEDAANVLEGVVLKSA
jgi:predicted phosphate transport protein (TIGR00153 family)